MKKLILIMALLFSISISIAVPPITICQLGTNSTLGIKGIWHCNEVAWDGTPNEVIDASGNGHHGTATNADTTDTAKFGRAGDYDGDTDYVTIADHADFDVGSGNLTIVAWFRSTSIATRQRIVDKYLHNNVRCFFFEINISKLSLVLGNAAGDGAATYAADTTLESDKWYMGVAVFDNDNDLVHLYVNGVADMTPTAKADDCASNDEPVFFGTYGNSPSDGEFVGQIDEVVWSNESLSADKIHSEYYKQVEVYIN